MATPSSVKNSTATYAQKLAYTWIYLIIRTILSGFISGAINYGIAYAMYAPPSSSQPNAYKLPSTLLGDFVVTIFVQGFIVWVSTCSGVYADLRTGIAGATVCSPNKLTRLLISIRSPKRKNSHIPFPPLPAEIDAFAPLPHPSPRLPRLLTHAWKSAVLSELLYLPTTLIIVYVVYGVGSYDRNVAVWCKTVASGCWGGISGGFVGWGCLCGWQVEMEEEKEIEGGDGMVESNEYCIDGFQQVV